MRKVLGVVLGILWGMLFYTGQAAADCIIIDCPDAPTYRGDTARCAFDDKVLLSTTTSCQIGDVEVASFSNPLSVRRVPNWAWGTPPCLASATPWIGFNPLAALTVTLVDTASIAGLEWAPNVFEPAVPVTVSFEDTEGNEVARITRVVLGRAGAQLFAVRCDDAVIASLVVTASPAAQGFAIADVRSDSFFDSSRHPSE